MLIINNRIFLVIAERVSGIFTVDRVRVCKALYNTGTPIARNFSRTKHMCKNAKKNTVVRDGIISWIAHDPRTSCPICRKETDFTVGDHLVSFRCLECHTRAHERICLGISIFLVVVLLALALL